MNYLLDSNVFIQAKNTYYGMDICPSFWDWLLYATNEHGVASIDFVRKELEKGNDELTQWIKHHSHLFIAVDDEPTQEAFCVVANYVYSLAQVKEAAKGDFLSDADPSLIAKLKR